MESASQSLTGKELDGDVAGEQRWERAPFAGNRLAFGIDGKPREHTGNAGIPESDVAEPG